MHFLLLPCLIRAYHLAEHEATRYLWCRLDTNICFWSLSVSIDINFLTTKIVVSATLNQPDLSFLKQAELRNHTRDDWRKHFKPPVQLIPVPSWRSTSFRVLMQIYFRSSYEYVDSLFGINFQSHVNCALSYRASLH
jgi:hypothetical protein